MKCDFTDRLREGLGRDDPRALYWALILVGHKKAYELIEQVRPHLTSQDANVRAAACRCLGELKLRLTDRWLLPRLEDEAWFVQCHAAKALGEMGASWAADDLAKLLSSPQWSVRQNAAHALAELGPAAQGPAENVLFSDDGYARNSAVEVLAHLGWPERTVERAQQTGARELMELLERFGRSGGLGHLENALWVVPESAVPLLLGLLEKIGDRATYGRIRASRYRFSPEVQELALATAERVKAR
jgi:HEAT repeat protein